MAVRSDEIASIIRQQIQQFGAETTSRSVGTVVEAGDGIARIHGLSESLVSELLEFSQPGGESVFGIAMNLEEDTVAAVILGDYEHVAEGTEVKTRRSTFSFGSRFKA